MTFRILGIMALLLLGRNALAEEPVPLGEEFQVNSYTTGAQYWPAIAMDGEGNFLVVWSSDGSSGTDTSLESVQGQRFAANAVPVGSEFQVNTYTTDRQTFPRVARDAVGNSVVVWASSGEDGSEGGIRGRRFDAAGVPAGDAFAINTYTTGNQWAASVSMNATGEFIVVWQSAGSAGADNDCNSNQGHIGRCARKRFSRNAHNALSN